MNYFNETMKMTKRYIEQLKNDGISDVTVSGKKMRLSKWTPSGKSVKRGTGRKTENKPAPPVIGGNELQKLSASVKNCRKCPLSKSRKNVVFGEGNPHAKLMFIGEGPGFDEDRLGRPFVGRAGKLLDKIITEPKSLGLKREDVYIANIVKCHPMVDPTRPDSRGNDRKPNPDEMAACIPYLEKQVEIIKPKIICALGSVSATTLTGIESPIGKLRGKFYEYKGTMLIPTYHPAALLRNPGWKADVWEDIKKIKKAL